MNLSNVIFELAHAHLDETSHFAEFPIHNLFLRDQSKGLQPIIISRISRRPMYRFDWQLHQPGSSRAGNEDRLTLEHTLGNVMMPL